jgi:hypothetical protein
MDLFSYTYSYTGNNDGCAIEPLLWLGQSPLDWEILIAASPPMDQAPTPTSLSISLGD